MIKSISNFIHPLHTMLYGNLGLLPRDYTHWTPDEVGFLPEVLVKDAKLSEDNYQYCAGMK